MDPAAHAIYQVTPGRPRPATSDTAKASQAQRPTAGEPRFALLDDPIQNMDDFNVLGLLDLLRSVSGNRQVVLSTHDVQLGELMRRKLRPLALTRRTITHEFIGYDEFGPRVETQIDEFSETQELLPVLVA